MDFRYYKRLIFCITRLLIKIVNSMFHVKLDISVWQSYVLILDRLFKCTESSDIAAGVTPGIRAA
jgi:hypothetical protein